MTEKTAATFKSIIFFYTGDFGKIYGRHQSNM